MVVEEIPIAIGRDEKEIRSFGYRGMGYIGRVVLGKGDRIALGRRVLLDMSKSHVILVLGKRGYGKSYTLGVVMEEFDRLPYSIRSRMAVISIDTLGVYWTLRYPAQESGWDVTPSAVQNFKLLVPYSSRELYQKMGVKVDGYISLRSEELDIEEWKIILNLGNDYNLIGTFLDIYEKGRTLDGMIAKTDESPEGKYIRQMLLHVKRTGFIRDEAPPILSYIRGGSILNFDISVFRKDPRLPLVFLSVMGRKLLEERLEAKKLEDVSIMKGEVPKGFPLVWMIIDEGHIFAPQRRDTPSREILRMWAKLGRQPGLGLIIATQQPSDLDRDIITQTDIFISHRLTSKIDLDALSDIKPTYISHSLADEISQMGHEKGLAVVLDDITERNLLIKIRPRMSMHGGFSASALRGSVF